jgi:hypothetical protein
MYPQPAMTNLEDFPDSAQEFIKGQLHKKFPDALPNLETYFSKGTGALTRNQVVFFERLWAELGPSISARELWETLKHTRERSKVVKRPLFRQEAVVIFGHKVQVLRDTVTGRFVRKRRRR